MRPVISNKLNPFAIVVLIVGGVFFFINLRQSFESKNENSEILGTTTSEQPYLKEVFPTEGVTPELVVIDTDRSKLRVLLEILKSKNDNDPRLDQEFRVLSSGLKKLMMDQYTQLAPEARNERGTLVFLIGRAANSQQDLNFLSQVLGEPRCLSLSDCTEAVESSKRDHEHFENAHEVTLAYPQLVALKRMEILYKDPKTKSELKVELKRLIKTAKGSPVPQVAALAAEILVKLTN